MTQQLQPWQYWSSAIFAGTTTIGGAALIIFGISFLRDGFASKNWPTTTGEIKAVNIVREFRGSGNTRRVTHHLTLNYSYQVGGISYTNTRYSLGDGSTASKRYRERSQAIAEKNTYPIGSKIDVYYKPTEPSFAILQPGTNFGTFVPLVLGTFFLPSGIMLFVFILKYPPQ
ncbi:DUF3592 domain-containing protein [[Limnothrix rosea] IAM M-220]|uniref:DUF3592 domain-containing protein n=1 Tax=[Limnothrix rosea] IAM M-220 TaxID=454133 RepID=UPI00096998C9|nr:DUF3592 domain-containing protein [[Limnothrix rosea] IAM M-220]OKH18760.1 hypothetical protein NIES208_04695 [[Limnothrix rosea] IAM M-220]